MAASRCDGNGFSFLTGHFFQRDNGVALRVENFQYIADRKTVLDENGGPAVFGGDDIADIVAVVQFGCTGHVVLVFPGVVTFVEAVGIAAVCQSLEGAQQGDIEWPAGHGIINGLAVGLGSPDDIVYGFGAVPNTVLLG